LGAVGGSVPGVDWDLPGYVPIVNAAKTTSRRTPWLRETRYKVNFNFVKVRV
jgi:hypothetical protein